MRLAPTHIRQVVIVILLLSASLVLGQESGPAIPTPTPPSALAQVDTLAKIVAALITGLAALIGLPLVFLTYRKTKVEITKLELEANALRVKQDAHSSSGRPPEGNIRINVENSPDSTINVLADPRFLAPLLILLDFIFAWIALTMAGYFLSVFALGIFGTILLTVLSAFFLMPIARQVLRVRAVLSPPRTSEEIRALQRQARWVAYALYSSVIASCLLFGPLLLLVSPDNLTGFGRYFAWCLVLIGVLLTIGLPVFKRRLDQYLLQLHKKDSLTI
jgi:hypothetical protein